MIGSNSAKISTVEKQIEIISLVFPLIFKTEFEG